MNVLKVICVVRINKTAEVLAGIAKRSVTSQGELTSNRELQNLFTGSRATPSRRIIDTAALLTKQGFVSTGQIDGEIIYRVTPRGQKHLSVYRSRHITVSPSSSWGGVWYLVTFEIPETRKAARNTLITQLKRQGFVHYLKGLWVIPYNPDKFINALRKQLDLKTAIKIIEARALDGEHDLKQHFGLGGK